ncbi:MAG: hypothetical protein JNM77_16640 [Pseudonocardia sp.]|nr:hypothetical protein [Pseudonocardia sp.]
MIIASRRSSPGGDLTSYYRTLYNMVREVPVPPISGRIAEMGSEVFAGQLVGEAWDPPRNVLHLHFAMALPHEAAAGWRPDPELGPLFGRLHDEFSLVFTAHQKQEIRDFLTKNGSDLEWPRTEWFMVDPFGLYDIRKSPSGKYGPVDRGFYYPVSPGPGTNAFRPRQIGGDPAEDRIPLFAWHEALLDKVPVQPMSMGTMCAILE